MSGGAGEAGDENEVGTLFETEQDCRVARSMRVEHRSIKKARLFFEEQAGLQ